MAGFNNNNGTSMRRLFSEGQFNNSTLVSNHNKKRLNRIMESTTQFSHNGETIPIDVVNYILELSEISTHTIQRQKMLDTYINEFSVYMNNNKERWPEEWGDRSKNFKDIIKERIEKYDLQTKCFRIATGTCVCGVGSVLFPFICSSPGGIGLVGASVLYFLHGLYALIAVDAVTTHIREITLRSEANVLVREAHNHAKNVVTQTHGTDIEILLKMRPSNHPKSPNYIRLSTVSTPSEALTMIRNDFVRGGKRKTRRRKPKKKTRKSRRRKSRRRR